MIDIDIEVYFNTIFTEDIRKAVDYLFEREHIIEILDNHTKKNMCSKLRMLDNLKSNGYLIIGDSRNIECEIHMLSQIDNTLLMVYNFIRELKMELIVSSLDLTAFYKIYSLDTCKYKLKQDTKIKLSQIKSQILPPLVDIKILLKYLYKFTPDFIQNNCLGLNIDTIDSMAFIK